MWQEPGYPGWGAGQTLPALSLLFPLFSSDFLSCTVHMFLDQVVHLSSSSICQISDSAKQVTRCNSCCESGCYQIIKAGTKAHWSQIRREPRANPQRSVYHKKAKICIIYLQKQEKRNHSLQISLSDLDHIGVVVFVCFSLESRKSKKKVVKVNKWLELQTLQEPEWFP